MKRAVYLIMFVVVGLGVLGGSQSLSAASLPPWPNIYSGDVTLAGTPAPDGAKVFARIGTYTSQSVEVKNGRYAGLAVGGPDSTFFGKTITFHLNDLVTAAETDTFKLNAWIVMDSNFNLTFPAYPTPTPTPPATATATPVPTATPDLPSAMEISGVVELDSGEAADLEGKQIIARVGSHFSSPATLHIMKTANYAVLVFDGLVLDPMAYKFVGRDIQFIIDGLIASGNEAVFSPGESIDLALRVSLPELDVPPVPQPAQPLVGPTEEPTATATAVPEPTVTPVPTQTPVPAAPTAVPSTPVPPTPVVLVVTATPEPEIIPVEEEGGGGCNLAGPVSPLSGAANTMMLFAPLFMIAAYKGVRRRRK